MQASYDGNAPTPSGELLNDADEKLSQTASCFSTIPFVAAHHQQLRVGPLASRDNPIRACGASDRLESQRVGRCLRRTRPQRPP
jgi:hypothetical protein